jgi:hypothetical protein
MLVALLNRLLVISKLRAVVAICAKIGEEQSDLPTLEGAKDGDLPLLSKFQLGLGSTLNSPSWFG